MAKDTWKIACCNANNEAIFQAWEKSLIKFPTTQIAMGKYYNSFFEEV